MKNYRDMTDFEVNKMVSAYLWGSICAVDEVVLHGEKDGAFDPCNSWDDAGPIILANKITISAPMEYEHPADWIAYPASDSDICVLHLNPLRAAMIVFMMMQEGV